MAASPTELSTILESAAKADETARALGESNPARLERLQRYLAESFPLGAGPALRFTQHLCVLQSLVMKRHAHDLREGPLSPADRILLAQQEVDLTVLAHLAIAAYEAQVGEDFEHAAQASPRPLQLADRMHPGDLDPEAPWAANEARGMAVLALTHDLVAAWEAGDVAGTVLEKRHSSLPAILQMLVTQLLVPAIESGVYGPQLATHLAEGSTALWDALGEAVCAGYCLAIAHGETRGDLRDTANRMLDPAEILMRLIERAEGPAYVPTNPLVAALMQVLVAELIHDDASGSGGAEPDPVDAQLDPLLERAVGLGFCAAAEEERSASPLPAGR